MSDVAEVQPEVPQELQELTQLRSEVAQLRRVCETLTSEVRKLVRETARATAQRQVEQTDSIVTVHKLDGGGLDIRIRDTAEQTQVTKQALEEALQVREQDWLGGYDE